MKSVDVMVLLGKDLEFVGDIPDWCESESWYVVIRRAPRGRWRICPVSLASRDEALALRPRAIEVFLLMEQRERRLAAAWN